MGTACDGKNVSVDVVMCCCHVSITPFLPFHNQSDTNSVEFSWGGEGRGGAAILRLRLYFLIGTPGIDHACRCALAMNRLWLSQWPLGMTASSPTSWLSQWPRGGTSQ